MMRLFWWTRLHQQPAAANPHVLQQRSMPRGSTADSREEGQLRRGVKGDRFQRQSLSWKENRPLQCINMGKNVFLRVGQQLFCFAGVHFEVKSSHSDSGNIRFVSRFKDRLSAPRSERICLSRRSQPIWQQHYSSQRAGGHICFQWICPCTVPCQTFLLCKQPKFCSAALRQYVRPSGFAVVCCAGTKDI